MEKGTLNDYLCEMYSVLNDSDLPNILVFQNNSGEVWFIKDINKEKTDEEWEIFLEKKAIRLSRKMLSV